MSLIVSKNKIINNFYLNMADNTVSGKNDTVGINIYSLNNSSWKKILFEKGKISDMISL